jgi:hypothetical protein
MIISDSHILGRQERRPRPQLLAPLGWFAVLAIVAIAAGAVLGFVV